MKPFTKFLRSQLSLWKPFLSGCSLETVRRGQDGIGRLMAHSHKDEVTRQDLTVGSMECAMITPKDVLTDGIVLYLHGGGFVAGNLDYACGFGTVLSAQCGIRVLCAAYRLAPEAPFPAALDDALDAYAYLIERGYAPSRIVLCGESAGGGLCYSLCLRLREKGWSMPACILAISPWVDLSLSGASYEKNRACDPSMVKERLHYFADCHTYGATTSGKHLYPKVNADREEDRRIKQEPLRSPLFASLEKMPPSLLFVGGCEIMLDDTLQLADRLHAAGCECETVVAPSLWHGYLLYSLKERQNDFDRIRRFVKIHVPHQKKLRWMSLDNAAKIFPAARRRSWSNVFRLSATMDEPVDREALQTALDVTVRRFPSIAARLRSGVFWYYLEEIPHAPRIVDEKPYPLSRMVLDDIRKCAFRVTVYDCRMAVEFFHALTDGNGGLIFLKTLVAEYLYQRYGTKLPPWEGILNRLEEPSPEELEDSFLKYEGPTKASRADTNSFRIKGVREVDGFKTNTTFCLSAPEVAARAKALGITVTAYLSAVLIEAACEIQAARVRRRRKWLPVKVCIPVNLRKLFPSKTLRNFVLYTNVGIDPTLGDYTFEEIGRLVHHQMKLQITAKNMAAMIATNVGDEKPLILRMTPLFLKNIVMKSIFNAVGEKKSCFSLSNLGVVTAPEEFTQHVRRMDFVLGSQAQAPYNTSLITYGDVMYLNVIRNMKEPVLEREIHKVLRRLGLRATVESNSR
ncbi:MAG: alpha/beta hydrolase fold domain-containing protein [Clostridia bacterium]|nr:alpha/beta hydrolase fold domain-containing protein [Clostridia bacterium]